MCGTEHPLRINNEKDISLYLLNEDETFKIYGNFIQRLTLHM